MMGLVDLLDEEAGIAATYADIRRTEDPHEMLRLTSRIHRQIRERCGDIVALAREGASTDRRLAGALGEGIRRRHAALKTITKSLYSHRRLSATTSTRRPPPTSPRRSSPTKSATSSSINDIGATTATSTGWPTHSPNSYCAEHPAYQRSRALAASPSPRRLTAVVPAARYLIDDRRGLHPLSPGDAG